MMTSPSMNFTGDDTQASQRDRPEQTPPHRAGGDDAPLQKAQREVSWNPLTLQTQLGSPTQQPNTMPPPPHLVLEMSSMSKHSELPLEPKRGDMHTTSSDTRSMSSKSSVSATELVRHVSRKTTLDLEGFAGGKKRRKTTAGTQTPFGLNRYIILIIIVMYVTCIGTHFFNWTPWEKILLANGAFEHHCTNDVGLFALSTPCPAQVEEIRGLLPIATVSMFSFTFLAGFLLDLVGPKSCSLFGITLLITGWTVLAFADGPFMFKTGFVLMGAGTDPAFFGTLSVANLFPGYGSTIISLLGAARSLSNIWPLMMFQISKGHPGFTFSTMSVVFAVAYAVCTVIVIILIPNTPYEDADASSSTATSQRKPTAASSQQPNKLPPSRGSTETPPQLTKETTTRTATTAGPDTSLYRIAMGGRTTWRKLKRQLSRLVHYCADPQFAPLVGISIANIIRNNFYLTSAATQLGPVEPFLSVVNVLTFLPGPILGFAVDKLGPLSVLTGLNTTNALAFVTLYVGGLTPGGLFNTIMRYASVLVAFPGLGFLQNQIYTFVAVNFPAEDMGKLAGIVCFVAGLCGLVVSPMTSFSERAQSFWQMNLVCIVLSIFAYGMLGLLIWRKRSSGAGDGPPSNVCSVQVAPNDTDAAMQRA